MKETCTSKCLIAAVIEIMKARGISAEAAFEQLRPQIKGEQLFVAARSLDALGSDDEFGAFGATTSFEDAVSLLADAMINGHEQGVASWEARYADLKAKTQTPPKDGERLIINQWGGYNAGKTYIRLARLDELPKLAVTRVAHQEAAHQRELTDARDLSFGRSNRYY